MRLSDADRTRRAESELSVLGAVMLTGHMTKGHADAPAIYRCIPTLDGVEWSKPAHTRIWRAMVELAVAGMPIDSVTIADKFGDELDSVGGIDYLVYIDQAAATAVNIEHHAGIVASLSRKAAFLDTLRGTASEIMAADSQSWAVPASSAIAALSSAMTGGGEDPRRTSAEIATELVGQWQDAEAGVFRGSPLGWHPAGQNADITDGQGYLCCVDDKFGGVEAGHLLVLGARPKHGKTTICTTIVGNVCDAGGTVLMWSGEVPLPDVASRIIHRKARRVFADRARAGRLKAADGDHDRLMMGVKAYNGYDLHLIDTRVTKTVGGVIAEAMRVKAVRGKLDLVVIDQATLIDPTFGKYGRMDAGRYYEICAELKAAGAVLGAPILLVSQVSQEVEKRVDKRPGMSDMFGADAFAQYADRLMMLYRHRAYDDDAAPVAELRVVANRYGPTGMVYIQDRIDFGYYSDPTPEVRAMVGSG